MNTRRVLLKEAGQKSPEMKILYDSTFPKFSEYARQKKDGYCGFEDLPITRGENKGDARFMHLFMWHSQYLRLMYDTPKTGPSPYGGRWELWSFYIEPPNEPGVVIKHWERYGQSGLCSKCHQWGNGTLCCEEKLWYPEQSKLALAISNGLKRLNKSWSEDTWHEYECHISSQDGKSNWYVEFVPWGSVSEETEQVESVVEEVGMFDTESMQAIEKCKQTILELTPTARNLQEIITMTLMSDIGGGIGDLEKAIHIFKNRKKISWWPN